MSASSRWRDPLTAAERAYGALLRLYPRAFRQEAAEDMAEMFRDVARDALARGGRPEVAALLLRAARDTIVHAPLERARALTASRRSTPEQLGTRPLRTTDPMDTLMQDVRYALRGLLRRPAFAAIAVLTLTLGIGATTTIFSIVNGVMLRPLPYPEPERLVMVRSIDAQGSEAGWSYPNFVDLRAASGSFVHLCGLAGQSVNLTGDGQPERVTGNFASAGCLSALGVTPLLGRVFRPEETELATAERVVVLSTGFWQRRFGGDRGVVGRPLTLNGDPYVVVGIIPEDFKLLGEVDVWLPITAYPNAGAFTNRGRSGMAVSGRLRPGVTIAQAEAELAAIARRLAEEHPRENPGLGVRVVPMHEMFVRDVRTPLLIMLGAVGFVLLISCANVANLQLARAVTRHKEMSVRAALGAGRRRLVRQLLTESLVLSALGCALGLAFAHWAVRGLRSISFDVVQIDPSIGIDGTVLVFAIAVSVMTGVVFGIAPAMQASRVNLATALSASGRSGTPGAGRLRIANALVVVEVALSLVLLTGAGLLTKSFARMSRVDPGFEPRGVLSMEFRLPPTKYATPERIGAFFDEALQRIQRVPGVEAAALVRAIPFSGNFETIDYRIEGRDLGDAPSPSAQLNTVSPDYFRTMRIALLQGRVFTDHDAAGAPLVAIIDRELARREFANENPIGRRLTPLAGTEVYTIVGVVENNKRGGLNRPHFPQVFTPVRQNARIFTGVVVRADGDPMRLAPAVREAIWAVDRDQPVWKIRTVDSMMAASMADERFVALLMGAFAIVALLLASVGIYGVMAYAVSQRTREIGIRMALGAATSQVLRSVLRQGMTLTLVALAVGLAASFGLTRFLSSLLFEVAPSDPGTYATVAGVLASVALAACWLPARRAASVDPARAMGGE